MSSVATKVKAGTAAIGLAGAAALAGAGVAPAQSTGDDAWAAGCAVSPLNFCDLTIDVLAIPLNMALLGFSDPVTGNATFKTGTLVLGALGPVMAGGVDSFAQWLMGPDQEVTFGNGGGDPTVTFFLGSYKGVGFTVKPT